MIKRDFLVRRCNPKLNAVDIKSPLTIGNGDFAFTADVTGVQTLYDEYLEGCPLLTMSSDGWHTTPNAEGGIYTLSDIEMTGYRGSGRTVKYPVERKTGNEKVYDWLRENPHRMNLYRLRFLLDGQELSSEVINDISQELDMYTGVLTSSFFINGKNVRVTTAIGLGNTLGVKVESQLFREGLEVELCFPYGSPLKEASDFEATDKHTTKLHENRLIECTLDNDKYYVLYDGNAEIYERGRHRFVITKEVGAVLSFSLSYSKKHDMEALNFKQILAESEKRFYRFWNTGAFIDVTESLDERAWELERRIVCSMYLTYIQCTGCLPPQETGLTCNSWYGKFHLEMHPLHAGYLPLFGRGELLEKSLAWYLEHLKQARANAKRNGYKGARWPKMVGPEGIDSPSVIAPLLIWQQPHLIYLLELIKESRYRSDRVEVPKTERLAYLKKYRDIVFETAEFMADYAKYNETTGYYDLPAPVIPAQENHKPMDVMNPSFELSYWKFGLKKAYEWLKELGEEHEKFLRVSERMSPVNITGGLIQAHAGLDNTYSEFNHDHPSMLFSYGWLSEKEDRDVVLASLNEFRKTWDMESLWGWDFAELALVYAKLGLMDEAFDVLLWDTSKNTYVASGNNAQSSRRDLPLYLPGNGSLLLAMTALKSTRSWYVKTEGIMTYPF